MQGSPNGIHSLTSTPSQKVNGVVPSYAGYSKQEVTRLIIQSLQDLGYKSSSERLAQESGFQVENEAIGALRDAVLQAKWSEVEELLLNRHKEGLGLAALSETDEKQMRFLIREEKFRSQVDEGQRIDALVTLQTDLQPLKINPKRLNTLAGSLLVRPDHDPEGKEERRGRLLDNLSGFIAPSVMIPSHRMATLLDQVCSSQISRCLYHNPLPNTLPSLFVDHVCDKASFPLTPRVELPPHDGEVWYVVFSHNGKYLATCGKSTKVVVYSVGTNDVERILDDHADNVVHLAWSPDDSKLITCSQDSKARVFDMIIIDHHDNAVSSATWSPDGQTMVTGSLSKHSQLCLRAIDSQDPFVWSTDVRVQDCTITPDGRWLIVMSACKRITVYDLATREEEYSIEIGARMTCLTVSRDSTCMLINLESDEIQLIDIESAELLSSYVGQSQAEFIIRSTFGGSDQGLIVSGSAGKLFSLATGLSTDTDSRVYIWHRETGQLIESLPGHDFGCVNSVSWNPVDPTMFASGGDDRKVRIWGPAPPHHHRHRQRHDCRSRRIHQRNYERTLSHSMSGSGLSKAWRDA